MDTAEQPWLYECTVSDKLQGHVWMVRRPGGGRGYFKYCTKDQWYYSGPMAANELIAAHLAGRLGYPAAHIEQASVVGPDGRAQAGLVSVKVDAAEVKTWNKVGGNVRRHPERYVENVGLLSTLVVFDAWIANVDRAKGSNIVLYRDSATEHFNWYLIDHALALYGSPYKWEAGDLDDPFWQQIWRFHHVPRGFLALQSSKSVLMPMVERIELLPEEDIVRMCTDVPSASLGPAERDFIIRLLTYRQHRLRHMISAWLEYKGVKEYAMA